MASREKVGNSVSEFLQDMSEYELTCPICFEEFKEPKSLPNCAHSVCLQCLEKMSERSSNSFQCPVCRVESPLPTDGVKAWPTNSRIVRLMDRFPGRQDKLAIKNAVERCKMACEATSRREEKHKLMSDVVKKEVEEKAQKLVEFIRDQERSLLDVIDEVMTSEYTGKDELKQQAETLTDKAASIIERGDVYEIVDAKDTLVSQLDQITRDLQPAAMNANFTDLLREKLHDEKQLASAVSSSKLASNNNNTNNVYHFDPKYNRTFTKTQQLDRFYPFDLATTSSGNLLVLDSRFQNVSIFDGDGNLSNQFKVSYDDLWGLAVLENTDEIIIVCNDTSDDAGICGYLLHFDIEGHFKKRETIDEFKNAFLTGISVDDKDNLIVTSGVFPDRNGHFTKGGLIVLSQTLDVKFLTFGSDEKQCNMRKAVYYQEKYYCTQLIDPGKEGCIKVFDINGNLLQEFGHTELCDPHGLVVDCSTSQILVCDRQLHAILVFNTKGQYLTRFDTKNDPVQIIMSSINNDIMVACYLGLCIQVMSYKWFSQVLLSLGKQ